MQNETLNESMTETKNKGKESKKNLMKRSPSSDEGIHPIDDLRDIEKGHYSESPLSRRVSMPDMKNVESASPKIIRKRNLVDYPNRVVKKSVQIYNSNPEEEYPTSLHGQISQKKLKASIPQDATNFQQSSPSQYRRDAPNYRDKSPTLFRIKSRIKMQNVTFLERLKHFCGCWGNGRLNNFNFDTIVGDNPLGCLYRLNPSHVLVTYLSWSFRTSFLILFLTSSIAFFILVIFFTLLLMMMGYSNPSCFQPNFNEANTPFADAYALSWTTFTTVGYGHIYPSLGIEEDGQHSCAWVHVLCSIESFFGVLYASCCGAIIFGKIVRIRSLAPVLFSDPITIRYGSGTTSCNVSCAEGKIPCPILTFRLVNFCSNRASGEFVNSQITVLAIFNEDETKVESNGLEIRKDLKRSRSKRFSTKRLVSKKSSLKKHRVVINEDPESMVSIQSYFHKLSVDTPENPYFKRTWSVNHILDEKSPLLLPNVKQEIRNNGGYWPAHLNDAASVRRSIKFDQIFVSFSGTSVANSDVVYAQHLYDYLDTNVGYKFVPVLVRDDEHGVRVAFEFLNDVVEQTGGGGEPFVR